MSVGPSPMVPKQPPALSAMPSGIEVIFTLLELKVKNPQGVFMARGNHEDEVGGEWLVLCFTMQGCVVL